LLAMRSLIGARRGKNRCKLSDLHVIGGGDSSLCKLLRRERQSDSVGGTRGRGR
jgi:hypothetical protein